MGVPGYKPFNSRCVSVIHDRVGRGATLGMRAKDRGRNIGYDWEMFITTSQFVNFDFGELL